LDYDSKLFIARRIYYFYFTPYFILLRIIFKINHIIQHSYIAKTSNNKIKRLTAKEIKITYGHLIFRNKKLGLSFKYLFLIFSRFQRDIISLTTILFYQIFSNCPTHCTRRVYR